MEQLYVPDEVYLICTDGMTTRQLQVSSQYTVKIANGRLAATVNDRTGGNFNCAKMILAGAIIGALVALVVCAAIVLSGGTLAVGLGVAMAGGAIAGGGLGFLAGMIPCICAMLTRDWYPYHPLVGIEGQYPLLETSKIPCVLGGEVQIIYSKELAEAYQSYKRGETLLNFGGIVFLSFVGGSAISSLASAGSGIVKVGMEYGLKAAAVQTGGTLAGMGTSYVVGAGYSSLKNNIPVGGGYTLEDVVTGNIYRTDSDLIQGETLKDQPGNRQSVLATDSSVGAMDEAKGAGGATAGSQIDSYYRLDQQTVRAENQSVIYVDPKGNASPGVQTTVTGNQTTIHNTQHPNASIGRTGSQQVEQGGTVSRGGNTANATRYVENTGTQYKNQWGRAIGSGATSALKGAPKGILQAILVDSVRAISNFVLSKKIEDLMEAEKVEDKVKGEIRVYEIKV